MTSPALTYSEYMLGITTYFSLWKEKFLHTPNYWIPRNLTNVKNSCILGGFTSYLLSYKNIYNICHFLFSRAHVNGVKNVEH